MCRNLYNFKAGCSGGAWGSADFIFCMDDGEMLSWFSVAPKMGCDIVEMILLCVADFL